MAVTVARDLTVQVMEDTNAAKLTDRQQALRAAIQRGEPKSLGVSQVMLGLMVMTYSIPLHFIEATDVIRLGVPWWSGLMFLTAGSITIILDKHSNMKILKMCLMVSLVSTVLSVAAIIIYSVDINKEPDVPCGEIDRSSCDEHFARKMSRGVKSSLLVFTLAQTVVSAVVCFLLYRQRRNFGQYASLSEAAPSTPTAVSPPMPPALSPPQSLDH